MVNEILFYCGIAGIVFTIAAAILFFIIYYIKKLKLNMKLDKEYGEKTK